MSSQTRKGKRINTENLPFQTLLFSSCYVDIESTNTVFFWFKNKYQKKKKEKNNSFLAPSKKYIMFEKFKDELKSSKNILNEIKKKLELLRNKK